MNHYIYSSWSIDELINGEDDQPTIITCPEHGAFRLTVGQHMDGEGCPRCALDNGYPPIETHKWAYTEQRVVARNTYGHINIHTVRIYTGYILEPPHCMAGLYDIYPRPIQRSGGSHAMEIMVTADTEEEAKAKGEMQLACYVLKQLGPSALRATCLKTQTCTTFDDLP